MRLERGRLPVTRRILHAKFIGDLGIWGKCHAGYLICGQTDNDESCGQKCASNWPACDLRIVKLPCMMFNLQGEKLVDIHFNHFIKTSDFSRGMFGAFVALPASRCLLKSERTIHNDSAPGTWDEWQAQRNWGCMRWRGKQTQACDR